MYTFVKKLTTNYLPILHVRLSMNNGELSLYCVCAMWLIKSSFAIWAYHYIIVQARRFGIISFKTSEHLQFRDSFSMACWGRHAVLF